MSAGLAFRQRELLEHERKPGQPRHVDERQQRGDQPPLGKRIRALEDDAREHRAGERENVRRVALQRGPRQKERHAQEERG